MATSCSGFFRDLIKTRTRATVRRRPDMNIAIFTPNYLPGTRSGGPVHSTHGLARALVGLGHTVDVLTTDVDGPDRLDVPLDRPARIDGVRVHYRPLARPTRLYYSPALARLAEEVVPTADAVHVNGVFLWPGPRISRIARRSGRRLVISPRGMLMPGLVAGKSRLAKRFWIGIAERSNLAGATAIHVTSQAEAEGLRMLGLDLAPIALLGNGVDLPEQQPDQREIDALWGDVTRGGRVAFFGRLGWNKGVDMAIAAVRAHPHATLRLAGHDEIGLRARLDPQLKRADGSVCGKFVGHLDGREKWAFLAGADVMLMPSLQENFGNALVEALAVGTPVIATEGVGAASYLRRIAQDFVVPRDQAALNHALAKALADPGRLARIGTAGRDLVADELQWPALARRMAEVYRGNLP